MPADPYKKKLPPKYQNNLDLAYKDFLGAAMSQSIIIMANEKDEQTSASALSNAATRNRSRMDLTNAEHHAM